jgi:hypothetical protein
VAGVQQPLVARVRVRRRHDALDHAEPLVQHLQRAMC